MWLETEEQRAELEKNLSEQAGVDLDTLRDVRRQLADFPAGRLVRFWFGKVEVPDELAALFAVLRKHLPTRAALFSWVYGPGHSVARDLLYVKIPSEEKRRLVNLVLAGSRKRYPWLNSRLIHAMAFRPRAFSNKLPQNASLEPWGPLYQRAVIPKGRGKRYLRIPNPPLKRIQKTLLRLIGPTLERHLLTCVFGASVGRDAPTFRNAVAHVGKTFIASFDIRDFFPSTRIDDILAGLRFLNRQSAIMVDPSLLPPLLANSKQAKKLAWTHDAEILVARLATFRGRLPQGSPLSPLLANVAFAPYDIAILEALTHEFGRDEFRYTRYFDDLTISVTRNAARNRRLSTPREVKRKCEELLNDVLGNAPYRLQQRKSRCSPSKLGHDVTGLVVRRDRVDLPRRLKRHLRSIIHHLRTGDFVAIARKWYSARGELEPTFQSIARGHRWQRVGLRRRRISAERLATLMLRYVYPDLRLERLLLDWYPWQEVFDSDESTIENRATWTMVEWLLAALWSGSVSVLANDSGDNEVIFQQGGVDVCKIMAESSLDFFYLQRDWAIAATEYWHHLRGLSGYLRACPEGTEFDGIHQWRNDLHDAMQEIRIETTSRSPQAVARPPDAQPDTVGARIRELTDCVVDEYNEFARRTKGRPDGSLGSRQQRFRGEVRDKTTFEDWICALAELFVRRLPLLPRGPSAPKSPSSEGFFDYLRVKHDQLQERISPHYRNVEQFEAKVGLHKQTDFAYRNAQHRMLQSLNRYFRVTTERRRELEGADANAWLDELPDNPWCDALELQLEKHVDQVEDLHCQLRSDQSEKRLFAESSGVGIVAERELLKSFDPRANSDRCWDEIVRACKVLYLSIFEAIEPGLCNENPEKDDKIINSADWKRGRVWKRLQSAAGPDISKRLKLIKDMRNRESHGESPDRRKEWVGIQRRVRDILGRSWDSKTGWKHPEYRADDDLELWAYEAAIVRLELLRDVGMWLEILRDDPAKYAAS